MELTYLVRLLQQARLFQGLATNIVHRQPHSQRLGAPRGLIAAGRQWVAILQLDGVLGIGGEVPDRSPLSHSVGPSPSQGQQPSLRGSPTAMPRPGSNGERRIRNV